MVEAEVMGAEQSELDSEPKANSLEGKMAARTADKVSAEIDEDVKVYATHNGKRVYGEGASMPTHFIGNK
ncbi:MAG: hypothetical protein AABX78_01245, partial [Nanoarchaeota archaeon]